MEDKDPNYRVVFMPLENFGEALQDYFQKLEILSPDRRIVSLTLPIKTDEEGDVPIEFVMNTLDTKGMN